MLEEKTNKNPNSQKFFYHYIPGGLNENYCPIKDSAKDDGKIRFLFQRGQRSESYCHCVTDCYFMFFHVLQSKYRLLRESRAESRKRCQTDFYINSPDFPGFATRKRKNALFSNVMYICTRYDHKTAENNVSLFLLTKSIMTSSTLS